MDKFKDSFRALLKGKFYIKDFPDHFLLYFTFFMLLLSPHDRLFY